MAAFVARVQLDIAFSLSDTILPGEEVYVTLPGFTKNESRTCDECARPLERVACRKPSTLHPKPYTLHPAP